MEPGQESVVDVPVYSYCSLLRIPLQKSTSVLEHYRKGGTKCWLSIFGGVSSDRIPKAKNDVNIYFCIYICTYINYTSEFRGLFEDTT